MDSGFKSDSKLYGHSFATSARAASVYQEDLFIAVFTGARIIRVLLAFAKFSSVTHKTDLLTFRHV